MRTICYQLPYGDSISSNAFDARASTPVLSFQALQVRLKHEEALEHNNGVWWRGTLLVLPLDGEAIRQRGIKRGADKVTPRKQVASTCKILPDI